MSDPVPTGCGPVDDLLGGGFERGTVTQVYGPPGAGKTNLVLSAAVETAVTGGRALFVDTEGLSVERFQQMAAARVDDREVDVGEDAEVDVGDRGVGVDEDAEVGVGADTGPWADPEVAADDAPGDVHADGAPGDVHADVAALAGRIIVEEAHDFDDQREAVQDTAEFASRAELVVLDSATGFYRLERTADAEAGDSLRQVTTQVTHLLSLARKHDLAVAVTNQVYTDPDTEEVRPLGGHTLAHWTGAILRLDRFRGGNRRATLEKHRSEEAGGTATFRIVESGLEGVDRA